MENARARLMWFEAITGLSINIEKTNLYKVSDSLVGDKQVEDWDVNGLPSLLLILVFLLPGVTNAKKFGNHSLIDSK